MGAEQASGLTYRTRAVRRQTHAGECHVEQLADVRLVIDHQHPLHVVALPTFALDCHVYPLARILK